MPVEAETSFEAETVPSGKSGHLDFRLVKEHLREDLGCGGVLGDGDLETILTRIASTSDVESRRRGQRGKRDVEGAREGEPGQREGGREEARECEVRGRSCGAELA